MRSATELLTMQEKSGASMTAMIAVVDKLDASIDQVQADKSRSRDYIVTTLAAQREKALPGLIAELKTIRDIATQTAAQKKYWESRAFLLSLQTYSTDPTKDAMIKSWRAAELSAMPFALLQLTFEFAKEDGNLPLIWQAFSAGNMVRASESGISNMTAFSLEGIVIPDRDTALAAISICETNRVHGESLFSAVFTQGRVDPVRKIQVGREMSVSDKMIAAAPAEDGGVGTVAAAQSAAAARSKRAAELANAGRAGLIRSDA
jgi:hypothetical protein